MMSQKVKEMTALQQKLSMVQNNLQQVQSVKKKQDQKLVQYDEEEVSLKKKVQNFQSLTQELSVVQEKLSSQIKVTNEKENELT